MVRKTNGSGTVDAGRNGQACCAAAAAVDAARDRFMERIGIVAQAEGMPRIAGRAFALLVFDGTEIGFADLAERLQVSRASISTNMRLLEERGLVRRLAKVGERQDHFRLAEDAYERMLALTRERAAQARSQIEASLREIPVEAGDIRSRVAAYSQFYAAVDDGLGVAISRITPPAR